jgi:hypothetical protein
MKWLDMDFRVIVWLVFAKMGMVYGLGFWLLEIGQGVAVYMCRRELIA